MSLIPTSRRTPVCQRALALSALTAIALSGSVPAALSAEAATAKSQHQARFASVKTTSTTSTTTTSIAATTTTGSLVVNGGFETSTAGWAAGPSPAVSYTRVAGGQSGAYSALLKNTATTTTSLNLDDAVNTVTSTTAGTVYTTSMWVRATAANQSTALRVIERKDGAYQKQSQSYKWLTDTAWTQVTLQHTAATTGGTLEVAVLGWDTAPGRSFHVDSISLVPGTPAPAPTTSPTPTVTAPTVTAPEMTAATKAIFPAKGTGALFGYFQQSQADVRPMETKIGRNFDAVHRYYDFNALQSFPTATDIALASAGRTVHIGWDGVSYNGQYDAALQPAPAGSYVMPNGQSRKFWSYKQITDGSLNRYIDSIADRIKATPYNYIMDFQHEMDDLPDIGGSNELAAAAGTRAEWVAAHRHIVDRFRARGAHNVSWAWTVSGWAASNSSKWWSYQQLWPGKGYVDVIMWDPYNWNPNNWRSFTTIVNTFYKPLKAGMLDAVDPSAKLLPMGLAEFGVADDPRREAWLRTIPTEIKAFPELVYTNYFSSGTWGALHNDPEAITAFGDAGRDGWFHTRD